MFVRGFVKSPEYSPQMNTFRHAPKPKVFFSRGIPFASVLGFIHVPCYWLNSKQRKSWLITASYCMIFTLIWYWLTFLAFTVFFWGLFGEVVIIANECLQKHRILKIFAEVLESGASLIPSFLLLAISHRKWLVSIFSIQSCWHYITQRVLFFTVQYIMLWNVKISIPQ